MSTSGSTESLEVKIEAPAGISVTIVSGYPTQHDLVAVVTDQRLPPTGVPPAAPPTLSSVELKVEFKAISPWWLITPPPTEPATPGNHTDPITVVYENGAVDHSKIEFALKNADEEDEAGRLYFVGLALRDVSFSGAAEGEYFQLKSDDLSETYDNPQWKDEDGNGVASSSTDGEHNYAVAYKRNVKPKVSASFSIQNRSHLGAFKVRAAGALSIPETSAPAGVLPSTATTQNLPNTVKHYPGNFQFDWEIKMEKEETGTDWLPVASSKHTMYVTLDTPKTDIRQETLFYIACKNADGQTAPATVTEKIWNEFETKAVKRVDGQDLCYYSDYRNAVTSTEELLEVRNGECGAWSKFFIDARRVHGIEEDEALRLVDSDLIPDLNPAYAAKTELRGFVIKAWNFHAPGTSGHSVFPYLNIPITGFIGPKNYNWSFAEVTEGTPDLPGQNEANPASYFNFHYLVKIQEQYYDPSYGANYASLDEFDDIAIAGFWWGCPTDR